MSKGNELKLTSNELRDKMLLLLVTRNSSLITADGGLNG